MNGKIAIKVVLGITIAVLLVLIGCTSDQEYREQADLEVYSILDAKWQEKFGYKANYKLPASDPNNQDVIDILPASRVLKQADAVGIATRYNRNYQSQKESLYLSALDLTLVRFQYAIQWFGTVDAFYTSNDGEEETTVGAQTGFNKEFLIGDGIMVGAGLAVDWTRFLTGDPDTSLSSVLVASLSAPLLGNGAGKAARENLTQAERNVLYDVRSFNRYRKTFVVSIISDYFRVLQDRNRVQIQKASYGRLVDSTNQFRMEVEVGKRPVYDLGESQQRLLSAEQGVVSAVQQYEQTLDNYKIRMALPTDIDVKLDPNELDFLETAGVSYPEYTVEEAVEVALTQRLDLANVRDGLDDAERKLILAAEGLGPQVDLEIDVNVDSTPETKFTRLRFHEGAYSMGVVADLPFNRKAERNAYRQALISVQRRQRDYDQEIDAIKLQVRANYREMVQTAESYRIQKIGLELAEKRVEVEKLSLQYGRGTVRLLLDSEDALVQAQDDVSSALVDHMTAKLRFFRDVGVLRVQPDGMWEAKRP